MNFRIPVKCIDNVKENGGAAIKLELPPDVAGEDTLLFASSRAMTYRTNDERTAAAVKKGDTLYLLLSDQKES